MGIRFEVISGRDALLNPGFILPQVASSREFDTYVCYAAIANERLAGVLVCDPVRFEPEILSIAVSPEFQGRGIATALLEYAIYDIASEADDHDSEAGYRFVATVSGKAGSIGAIKRVFEKNGFDAENEGAFYELEIADLEGNTYIQNPKYEGSGNDIVFRSLRETDRKLVRSFGEKLLSRSLVEEFSADELEEDLSVFGIKNGEIVSCLLFAKESEGVIQNYFLYNQGRKGAIGDKDLLRLFNLSAGNAMNKYPSDIRLSFWVGNTTISNMFGRIFPFAKAAEEAVDYELAFSDIVSDPDDRFTDGLHLPMYDNSKMVCADCIHCSSSVIECAKYLQKPDGVLEGGECSLKEV